MKANKTPRQPMEIELKLALLATDTQALARHLARTPPLQGLQPTRQPLHSVYFDTPDLALQQKRVALRIRRVGAGKKTTWIQTLKTSGQDSSALSARGEWEAPLTDEALSLSALMTSAWPDIDPDGKLFAALRPVFTTSFKRTSWRVTAPDGSVMEVAFDLGKVQTRGQSSVICELELELISGAPVSLFTMAQQLSEHVALIPLSQSKAARGHALVRGASDQPRYASPPLLVPGSSLRQIAQQVLREMFSQFTTNLDAIRRSDDPEVVHQARVGWRRFRSALRLFKPIIGNAMPSTTALKPMLEALGELRDLQVAVNDTLPSLASAYTGPDPQRIFEWQALIDALTLAASRPRAKLREDLLQPAAGACLLAITRFIEELPIKEATEAHQHHAASRPSLLARLWAKRRVNRFRSQLKLALADAAQPAAQHRARILAKRLRYAAEALQVFLPKRRCKNWLSKASELQSDFGQSRDVRQALALAIQYQGAPGVIEFLRGYSFGLKSATSSCN